MAIVPLLVISTNVMIAIRSSGTLTPATVSANTSLGFGHGTGVDSRTFMYDTRKQEKMNVSDSRKIHIIALPQGTWNVCLSEDQSLLMLAQAPVRASAAVIEASCAMECSRLGFSGGKQQREYAEPDQEQPMPIDRAELDAHADLAGRDDAGRREPAPDACGRPAEHPQSAQQMQAVHGRQQDEERVSRIGPVVLPGRRELPPRDELPEQERHREHAAGGEVIAQPADRALRRELARLLEQEARRNQE